MYLPLTRSFLSLLCAASLAFAGEISWKQTPEGFEIKSDHCVRRISFCDADTVRVTTALGDKFEPMSPSLVVLSHECVSCQWKETDKGLVLWTPDLELLIDKEKGSIVYRDAKGKTLLEELQPHVRDKKSEYVIGQQFKASPTEALYGLGQYQSGKLNHRGEEVLLVQANRIAVVPFLLSTMNYGILWDHYSKTRFKDDAQAFSFESKFGASTDYYFIAGQDMDDVISGYRELTGKAPLFSKSAYGYWQSKERYRSFAELISVVKEYRKRGLPIDNIVQDWQYWGSNDYWSGMFFKEDGFANPKENIKQLHDLNVKLMCSIWPVVGKKTELFQELDKINAVYTEPQASHWTKQCVYDAYNPKAREIYAQAAMRGLIDEGVDALWLDGSEVEVGHAHTRAYTEYKMLQLGKNYLGDFTQYLNTFSLVAVSELYNQFRAKNVKRPFILTRSAFAGQQRYGTVTWTGDIGASWTIFKNQIAAGLNFSAAGLPYWTHDIGGFFPSGYGGEYPKAVEDEAYRELYTRWFQFGAFTPIFRAHGTGTVREIYLYGDEGSRYYEAMSAALKLRYRLMPYVYSQGWNVYEHNFTLMRPLAMDFDDPKAQDISDAYMFGKEFLVHPVTRPMYCLKPEENVGSVIPAAHLRTKEGEAGLAVTYFKDENDEHLKNKVFSTIHSTIDFNWAGTSPENLPMNHYSMQWVGSLVAPETGVYRIGLTGDDGFELFINGEKLIDEWKAQDPLYKYADVHLEKGKAVDIKINYFQHLYGAEIKLTWFNPQELEKINANTMELDLSQSTYLPQGSAWYDYWTNRYHLGGASVKGSYPIDKFPLFVKAGSIIPMIDGLQYATQDLNKATDICIYAGADGQFTYYNDKGDGFEYLNGEYTAIKFTWNEASRTLTLRPEESSKMKEAVDFKLYLIDSSGEKSKPHALRYQGEEQVITFP